MTLTTTSCGQPGCGCGTTQVQSQSFVRPRFFAGQLLTQDDFQVLDDYLTAKSRLHNRHLFGEGVVCGLDVACHPCGEGRVLVHPGYALDCCGNDIVVPCLEELDVNRLIRDLQVEGLGGYDCGDPCADPAGSEEGEDARHYCLLVRYGETLTDPQAPYATEEPCGSQTCEPSRVREGYRFLLRCRHDGAPHDDLAARVKACLGDPRTIGDNTAKGRRFQKYGQAMAPAAQSAGRTVTFEAADAQRFSGSLDALQEAGLGDGGQTAAAAAADVPALVEHVRALAGALVRFDLHDDAGRAELVKLHPGLSRDGEARQVLAAAPQQLEPELDNAYPDPMDRAVARTALGEAARWSDAKVPFQLRRDRLEPRMLAQGAALDVALHSALKRDLAAIKEWLLDRLDERPSVTDCELRDKVAAIRVPADDQGEAIERSDLLRTAAAARELAEAQVNYVLACLCAAVNPPCPPCDDPVVPLACLEVRDCEVVDICNASRSFVLSGPTLRYWVPYLGRLGEFLEQACCALPDSLAPRPVAGASVADGDAVRLPYRTDLFEEAPDAGTERLANALLQPLDFAPVEVRQLLVAGAGLGGIAGDLRRGAPRALPGPAPKVAAPPGELDPIREELERLREEVATVRSDLGREKQRITRLQKR